MKIFFTICLKYTYKGISDILDFVSDNNEKKIKCVCEKCDKWMDLFKSLKKEYYRCRRFPMCQITANPTFVKTAIKNNIYTERISNDSVKLYRFDPSEKVVFISIVKKEKGVLNSLDDGIWR